MASQATIDRLCAEFDSPPEHIVAAINLLEQNATPAFLARYRHYQIGGMSEDRLVTIAERLHLLNELEQRRQTILEQAEQRGRRTEELEATLATTADQDLLDDYYQSMRPRRRGIAMQMEEKGLSPLAMAIQHRQFGDAAIETVPAPKVEAPKPEPAAKVEVKAEDAATTAAAGTETPAESPASDAPAADTPASDTPAAEATSDEASPSEAAPAEAATGEAPPAEAPAAEAATAETAAPAEAPAVETPTSEAPVAEPPAAETAPAKKVPDVELSKLAEPYVSAEQGIASAENALEGALLIMADKIAHDPATRARFREELRRGILRAKPVNPDGDAGKYKQFFDFAEPINRIPSNRMLALRRAEREKILQLQLTLPEGRHRKLLRDLHAKGTVPGTQLGDFYDLVFDHAASMLQDLCGKDVRRRLKEKADREAMRTYGRNLRSQLLAPPLGAKKVLSLRTSGKAIWAVLLNEDGSVGEHKTMPTDNDEQKAGALTLLAELIKTHEPHAIALPHGRRQAGSEKIVAKLREALGETPMPMVVPVDEAASTIFATSTAGKKAIPGVEVGARTAISLGRRLQDPLLELARMEVRTLGLGQTLDDVHQGTLQRELGRIKSACLAEIGCDVNTSGPELLGMLPGLGHERAQQLVKFRKGKGGFQNRAQVLECESINEACYRNIAPFMLLSGGDEPLDATPVHPDDYEIVKKVAEIKSCEPIELVGKNLRDVDLDPLTTEEWPRGRIIGVLKMLGWCDKDPRGELIASQNDGVHTLNDLHQDRELKGRIASLTEFGAFVDLGIGQDGLVHISQIPGHRLRDPNQQLRVGEVVTVWVLNVDQQKGKISLSMHQPRHLAEGRLPTLGERMEQGQGRRRGRGQGGGGQGRDGQGRGGRGGRDRGPRDPSQESRRPGSGGGRPGSPGGRRGAPGGGRDRDSGGSPFGGGGRDRGDRGPRRGGSREQRVYTVEPDREIAEKRTHKGEATSLSSLRNLLGKSDGDSKKD